MTWSLMQMTPKWSLGPKKCARSSWKNERISGRYDLKLNKDKCVNLNMNTEEQQTCGGGVGLIKAEEATYLGNTLASKANATMEVEKQM